MPNLMMSKCKLLMCNSKNKNPATLKINSKKKSEIIMEHLQEAGQVIRIIQTMWLNTIKLKYPITFSPE